MSHAGQLSEAHFAKNGKTGNEKESSTTKEKEKNESSRDSNYRHIVQIPSLAGSQRETAKRSMHPHSPKKCRHIHQSFLAPQWLHCEKKYDVQARVHIALFVKVEATHIQ